MASRVLNILAPTRYPWRFNGPRHSRHAIDIRKFLPMNRFSYKLEGFTVFNPFPPRRFDLIHTFNRIPLSTLPFVIGYESHLPRAYGLEESGYFAWLSRRLASNKCKRIVAISEYAKRIFMYQHSGRPWEDDLLCKLEVRYPNLVLPPAIDNFSPPNDTIRLVFTGHHFGRKGGAIAVRIAKLAHEQNVDMIIDIVSRCEVGYASWVDPTNPDFFAEDLRLLKSLPNVRHHNCLPNPDVVKLVGQAHFTLLPTFADTFGFSVIEGMSQYTPAIGTTQGALPEIIKDDVNGILLPLECNQWGDWIYSKYPDRGSATYTKIFRDEINRLAESIFSRILETLSDKQKYRTMRLSARQTAEANFDSHKASQYWDNIYEESCP